MIAVRDRLADLAPVQPVIVSFTDDPALLPAYSDHLQLGVAGIPLVTDPGREIYRALGAGRGRFRDVWSLGTLAMYARLLIRGRRLRRPIDDTRQLGADALIDADGRLVRLWLPDGPDHRPTIDEIVDEIARL